jgi:small subunit ribosomal protein S9
VKDFLSWDRLKDLKDQLAPEPQENIDVVDSKGRIYATGKRKTSIARVWIKPGGKGLFSINGRTKEQYFPRETLLAVLNTPFRNVNRVNAYDVFCTVQGGGMSGQAGAIRHGISKALQLFEPSLRASLKMAGLLTRDSRKVERKKPGLRKARRAPQFSKR